MYDTLAAMMGAWILPRQDIGRTEAPFARSRSEPAQSVKAREILPPAAQIALIANLSAAR